MPRRYGRTRMEWMRFCFCFRGCVCWPPFVCGSASGQAAWVTRLQSRNYCTAGLFRSFRIYRTWKTAPCIFSKCRRNGFDGRKLYGKQQAALFRCVCARRRSRPSPWPRAHHLYVKNPRGIQRRYRNHRRNRSQPPPFFPLWLLVKQSTPLNPIGQQGWPSALRNGRTFDYRNGWFTEQRRSNTRNTFRPRLVLVFRKGRWRS